MDDAEREPVGAAAEGASCIAEGARVATADERRCATPPKRRA